MNELFNNIHLKCFNCFSNISPSLFGSGSYIVRENEQDNDISIITW